LKKSGILFHGEQLKRLPRGFVRNDSIGFLNQDLIRYKGLKCWYQIPLTDQVYSADFISYCLGYYQSLLPLFEWMVEILNHFSIETDFTNL